jgi:hypothetical protein
MTPRRKILALALATGFGLFGSGPDWELPLLGSITPVQPAQARIGHPLTPLSYAGVARRTARRTTRRTVARVTALPPGCVYGLYYGAYYYNCGGVYYQRSGGVYIQVIVN